MTYHRPDALQEALEILATSGAQVIAGGTDIFPAVTGRELRAEVLDITGISALSAIEKTDGGWRIGAAVKWAEIARAKLPSSFQALQQAALKVGSVQIQNSATLVGNICNASPAADGIPPLLVLDAALEVSSVRGSRQVALAEFILGVRKIALEPDEIVTAILIPTAAISGRSAFEKFGARKYLVISICMVAVRVEVVDGKFTSAAVAVGASSPVVKRLSALEEVMIGSEVKAQNWQEVLQDEVQAALSPIDDIRADAESRKSAAVELVLSAIRVAT